MAASELSGGLVVFLLGSRTDAGAALFLIVFWVEGGQGGVVVLQVLGCFVGVFCYLVCVLWCFVWCICVT